MAAAIPIAAAVVGGIMANGQQKAAAKNNQNQQTEAVQNSQAAWQNAGTQFNNWQAANPSPVAGATVARPGGNYAPGANPNASAILGGVAMPQAAPPQTTQQRPGTAQVGGGSWKGTVNAPLPAPNTASPAYTQRILQGVLS